MAQFGEAYSAPTLDKAPEDPKNKNPLTIRIVLLCDGTNNNNANIAEREKFEANMDSSSYDDFGNGLDTSYDNGRTNIATMEPHVNYGEGVGGYSYVAKVYVQGQGTTQFQADDTKGLAMGAGLSGVYERAREGIRDALKLIHTKLLLENPPEKYFIKQVDVDVFGFSRGAATARHAIHVVTTEESVVITDPSGYGAQIVVTNQPLFDRLRVTYGYTEMHANRVKIIFAGLYDTVVSVNASQLKPAWLANNTRNQKAVAKARCALHLAAADEHRKDFPLHKIKSALDAGTGAEYYLPGVHSDIGGSYNLANQILTDSNQTNAEIRELKAAGDIDDLKEQAATWRAKGHKTHIKPTKWKTTRAGRGEATEGKLYVFRTIKGSEYVRTSSEVGRIINRGTVAELKADQANLEKDGWYTPGQLDIETRYLASAAQVVNPLALLNPFSLRDFDEIHSGVLVADRPNITSGYCNIPLKFMAERARTQALDIDAKLEAQANRILSEVKEFKALEASLRAYMGKKGIKGSKPSDWTDFKEAVTHYPKIKELRNKHLHNSTRFEMTVKGVYLMDPGFTPNFEKGLRRRFYYEG